MNERQRSELNHTFGRVSFVVVVASPLVVVVVVVLTGVGIGGRLAADFLCCSCCCR